MLYELLIRGTKEGNISGSHIIEFDAGGNIGSPRSIKDEDWAGIAPGINAALTAQISALEAEVASSNDALAMATEQIAEMTATQDGLVAQATVAFAAAEAGDFGPLREVLVAASQRDIERKRAAAEAVLAKAQADLAALTP